MKICLACRLNKNPNLVPGGRITEGKYWIVEHCIGPCGIGTLVIKTKRHKERFSKCTDEELNEFCRLFKQIHQAIEAIIKPDQIYVSKWGEETRHLHVLVQPISKAIKRKLAAKGPTLQAKMFKKAEKPDWKEAEKIAIKIRKWIIENS
jgi:diadenosine tetraphosphate (Ap4A) HIT family hydrolase